MADWGGCRWLGDNSRGENVIGRITCEVEL